MAANLPAAATQPDRTPKRVRHTLRFRALEVIKTERITPVSYTHLTLPTIYSV